MTVYRIRDPIRGDDKALFDEGVLEAEIAAEQVKSPDCRQI